MIEVEQAIQIITSATAIQRTTINIPILEAKGCVTAEDIYAPINVPHFPKSAMDGYALHSVDINNASPENPVQLKVVGEIWPGDNVQYPAKTGTTVRIMTGGAIPDGFDCVAKQEDSDYGENIVNIYKSINPFENWCSVGEDIKFNELVIPQHTILASQHIGTLASMGFTSVQILRPWRVGIISTGNELISPGHKIGFGQIFSSSSYSIASYLDSAGLDVIFMEICSDDSAQFCQLVQQRIDQVDAIITTGGVSVGKSDFIPAAIRHLGATKLFHGVNMKPGTPTLSAIYRHKPLLCLSGNPFAALVSFHLFFWPVLAKAMQNKSLSWKHNQAMIAEGRMKPSGLRRFLRAKIDDKGVHLYTKSHQSSVLSNLMCSNCIIDQPPEKALAEGDLVNIIFWKD